ncbi:hypothetical protein D1831_04955 [Lactiplantibacillus garii]|uniref:HotDog ACOT-type domain-containing protein n=1 Tax=Lactiplantibacillus garii TaxID=2306423 RepID=A0A426D8L3_9LACO|nr:hotdog domain-containing protein [Lactiplantibacillus garii]RRK10907.1 hypothetical protein D1831_04955 [Lactiplantibacillus garii]
MKNAFYQVEMGDFFVSSGMLNHLNILHGGVLLKHCDSTVGVLANRYSQSRVLTVAIKNFNFACPAHVGDHIWFRVTLLKTGHHSMTFAVSIFSQGFEDSTATKIGEGLMVFVAVSEKLRPVLVKPYVVTDAEQQTKLNELMSKFDV